MRQTPELASQVPLAGRFAIQRPFGITIAVPITPLLDSIQENETRFGGDTLSGETKERWIELCEQASKEQDPNKLMALVAEIDRLLEEKQDRINQRREEATD